MSDPSLHNQSRFLEQRPEHFRPPPAWHPRSYILRRLPEAIERAVRNCRPTDDDRIIDFGCAEKRYRKFFPDNCTYLGADLPGNPRADIEIQPDGRLPVEDASADMVLSTQVLEHVADPDLYLSEAWRVLRPGGRLVLSTHGIMAYHEDPVDYWRWTGPGLQKAITDAGFEVSEFEGVMGLAAVGLQLFLDATGGHVPRLFRRPYCWVLQVLVALFDRIYSPEGRTKNALVFVTLAHKPRSAN